MIYQRHILATLKQSLNEYPITLVTGARQVGKTTLVSVIEKENHYQYLTFDDTNLLALAKKSEEIRRGSSRTDHF